MSQPFKSREDFKNRIQEYKQEELSFLNEKANLKSFVQDNGWTQKQSFRKDQDIYVRKGEEVIIKFDSRNHRWNWRGADQDENVAKHPYQLGKLMVENDNRTKQLSPFQEDDKVRDLLRANVAKHGIDIRDHFSKYNDIIEWLEVKGARFPMPKNTPAQETTKRIEPVAPVVHVPAAEQTQQQQPSAKRMTEILLNETSLFKLAHEMGYRATNFGNTSRIPLEIIYDVKKKANIADVAKDFLEGVEKVGTTIYQAVNPKANVRYKSLLIDEATNRFEDKTMGLEGDVLTLLVSVKGMKFDEAVKELADMLRIEVPQLKQESKNTYFVKGDSVLKIERNEETGRYFFTDYEKNIQGTAFDLVKLDLNGGGDKKVSEKEAYHVLIELASKVLDDDRKAELQESYKVLAKNEIAVSMPQASQLRREQAEEEALSINVN